LICGFFKARYFPLEKTLHKAGVIRDGLMPAPNALIAVSTERGCAAALDSPKDFDLRPGQGIAIAFNEFVSRPADDIGHLKGWLCHA
jgi:hypothetical protein